MSNLHKKKTPEEKWEELKEQILKQIKEIDEETPWQSYEPNWWLHMMNVERVTRKPPSPAT